MAATSMPHLDTGDADAFDHTELVNSFTEFLSHGDAQDTYRERLSQMVEQRGSRLLVDMGDLRAHDAGLSLRVLRHPVPHLRALEEAALQVVRSEHDEPFLEEDKYVVHVGLTGSMGAQHVSPRALSSRLLGQLVSLEGIVTKMGVVSPKLVTAVHFCPATNKHHFRNYRDWAALDGAPTQASLMKNDPDGNPLEMDYGHCIYKNTQTLTIQEMPERAPLGQLPRSVEVMLEHDLVDSAKPGDRVVVVGLFRARSSGQFSNFRTTVIANSVQTLGKDVQGIVMTPKDLHNIRGLAQKPDVFDVISRSLAPSIYGHEYIKKALLLLLLGGLEKNLDNGTHLRGDINILMVGDPSTAKSQLLRFVLGIAPLAVSTTGRGSTGVGLTAAVTSDPETRERRLEAGAMVLADRGVVCIDEFDKMSDADRVAIHEVMEQQTVTIAKAGIHASLNARCSVVAAANPIYGQYDKDRSAQWNVNLADSLLSRFDLLFIVLDELDPEHDRKISEHILRLHRYERPGQEGQPFAIASGSGFSSMALDEEDQREDQTSPVVHKFNPLLHGGFAASDGKRDELLHTEFIRKYVHYAKTRIKPALTEAACDFINERYATLREEQATHQNGAFPVTARQLESLVRLSTAHAKARLSREVEVADAEEALKIMRFALYRDDPSAGPPPGGAAGQPEDADLEDADGDPEDDGSDSDGDGSGGGGGGAGGVARGPSAKRRRLYPKPPSSKRRQRLSSLSSGSGSEGEATATTQRQGQQGGPSKQQQQQQQPAESGAEVSGDEAAAGTVEVDEDSDRFKLVQATLVRIRKTPPRPEQVSQPELLRQLNEEQRARPFARRELEAILLHLETKNKVLFRDGMVMFLH